MSNYRKNSTAEGCYIQT